MLCQPNNDWLQLNLKYLHNVFFDLLILIMKKLLIQESNINGNKAYISGQDAKHITKVLRMLPKDEITFTDGKGKDFNSIIEHITPEQIVLSINSSWDSKSESPVKITLFQGMLKDKKMDTLIRHLTELGIYEWTPLFCERAIPKPDMKKLAARIKRWEKITSEALKQCNRSVLPIINRPVTFPEMIKNTSQFDLKITFWENATLSFNQLNQDKKQINNICVLIGPEGGFSKEEADLAEDSGFKICSLGPRILRSETASITACSLIQHYFGDI